MCFVLREECQRVCQSICPTRTATTTTTAAATEQNPTMISCMKFEPSDAAHIKPYFFSTKIADRGIRHHHDGAVV
jgi:hypothetical protein